MTTTESIQDTSNGVDIVLFPKIGEGCIDVHADVDKDIPYSILQKSVLDDLQLAYKPCQEPGFTDAKGRTHTPIGYIELQYHVAGIPKENTETFYVVESGDPEVELKCIDKHTDTGVRPMALGTQTSGMVRDRSVVKPSISTVPALILLIRLKTRKTDRRRKR